MIHTPLARTTLIGLLGALLVTGCALPPQSLYPLPPGLSVGISSTTDEAPLKSGNVPFNLYLPAHQGPAPLVVVAHGFNRNRHSMAGWGQKLAQEGFAVAVPDLPGFDHPRNGRKVDQLINWLATNTRYSDRIDSTRVGAIGLSNGGLWTLLAAAENSRVKVWVGLDPVDRHHLGEKAAPRVTARAVVLKAPPSQWNHNGNARLIEENLPRGWSGMTVADAVHIDPEWPTDAQAEFFLGKTSDERRMIFVNETIIALKRELLNPPLAGS